MSTDDRPDAGGRMVSASFYFEPEVLAALDALAQRLGWPKARLVREGADLVLAKYAGAPKAAE